MSSKSNFLDFWTCSSKNLLNSSCHFWKHQSFFLQILHQYSVPSNITPLYFFTQNFIYFGQKQPMKVQIFEILESSGQNLSNSSWQFWTFKAVSLHFLHHYSLSWHITPLQILSLYNFNFRPNDAIRIPFLRLSRAPVKICEIPHVIFGSASQFSFKLCINLECDQT